MTKEQAIKFANCLKNNYTIDFNDMADFCDTVIKALEQEPCEDCVSRAKALSAIRKLYPNAPFLSLNFKKWYEENKKYFACEDIIKALPPVTPTRKSGLHWIERFDNEDKWLECPYCHKDSDNAYNYCPNCGTYMRSNENEKDTNVVY